MNVPVFNQPGSENTSEVLRLEATPRDPGALAAILPGGVIPARRRFELPVRYWPYLLILLALPLVIWWMLAQVPLADLIGLIRSISLADLGLLALFNAIVMLIFSARWWLILRFMGHRLPYLTVFRYRMAGFAISYFTPGTQFGGEPLQVYALSNRHAIPASDAVASVTLDKLFELLANFTFLAIGIAVILRSRLLGGVSAVQSAAWVVLLLCLPLLYLSILGTGRVPVSSALLRLQTRWARPGILPRLGKMLAEAETHLSALIRRKPVILLWVGLASGLVWVVSLAEYWLALYILGGTLTPLQTVAALTAARLAFLTPVPGGLGALEAGQMFAMQSLGFGPALGMAISLWIRARDTALGLAGLWFGAGLVEKGAQPGPAGHATD